MLKANALFQIEQNQEKSQARSQNLIHLPFQFLHSLENRLCVFSQNTQQLFTNYEFLYPNAFSNEIAVLPDAGAEHDTFQNVTTSAIAPTGLHIIPGELVGKKGLHFFSASPTNPLYGNSVPLSVGIRRILSQKQSADPFLPIIRESDIINITSDMKFPNLHLYRLCHTHLQESLSPFDIKSLHQVIYENLNDLNQLI